MEITEELISHVAEIASLNLTKDELKKFTPQLKEILEFFSHLNEVDTSDEKISLHPVKIEPTLREDIPKQGITQEEALSLVKNKKDGYFKGPKIV